MQYGGGYSVFRRHIINKVEDILYRCVTPSVWRKAHHQHSRGYAVWTSHIINTEEGVQYMTTKAAQTVVGGCIYLKNDILQTI